MAFSSYTPNRLAYSFIALAISTMIKLLFGNRIQADQIICKKCMAQMVGFYSLYILRFVCRQTNDNYGAYRLSELR